MQPNDAAVVAYALKVAEGETEYPYEGQGKGVSGAERLPACLTGELSPAAALAARGRAVYHQARRPRRPRVPSLESPRRKSLRDAALEPGRREHGHVASSGLDGRGAGLGDSGGRGRVRGAVQVATGGWSFALNAAPQRPECDRTSEEKSNAHGVFFWRQKSGGLIYI